MVHKVRGIFAPIPTPFTDRGEVAWDAFVANVRRFGETSLDGIVVLGSNGEAPALRDAEKVQLVALAREHFPAAKPVIAGLGCESAYSTLALINEVAPHNSGPALILNPSYYKGSAARPQVMLDFFHTVADASPVPIMIYNMPANTGVNIPAAVICEASRHDNIIGVKDSGGNMAQIAAIISGSAPDFSVFAGSGSFLLPTLYMGGCGGTLAVANVAPQLCVDMVQALERGEHEEARRLQRLILPLNAAVTSDFGVPGLKFAVEQLGYYGGPCRTPTNAVASEEARRVIMQCLRDTGLLETA